MNVNLIRVTMCFVFVGVLIVAGLAALAQTTVVDPGQTIIVDLTGDLLDSNNTGATIRNLSVVPGRIGLVRRSLQREACLNGYGYLNSSAIRVRVSNLRPMDYRTAIRIEYDPVALRAAGIRRGTQRLMRFKDGLWRPAHRCIRKANVRKILWGDSDGPSREEVAFARAKGRVGNFGYSSNGNYVWGVMDVDGKYAVGGLIPEPITATTLLVGLSAMVLIKRRKT